MAQPERKKFLFARRALQRGAMRMSLLAASLVMSILAYGENPQDYSKNFTLAVNPKPLPIEFVSLDRKEVSGKRIDFAAALATIKLKSTPTFIAADVDDIQKDDEPVSLRPKPGASTIFGQLMAGMILGIATSGALGLCSNNADTKWTLEILGYPLGAAIGARLVVCRKNWSGNFLKALVGAYLGIPVSYGLIWFGISALRLGHGYEFLLWPAVFAPAPILSTILLDLSLRYKNPPAKTTSFLNVHEDGIKLDFPAVQVLPEHGKTKSWRWTVALASIEL